MSLSSTQFKDVLSLVQRMKEGESTRLGDSIVERLFSEAEWIAGNCVKQKGNHFDWDTTLDTLLTSKTTGLPIMFLFLGGLFWITIVWANYASEVLAAVLFGIEKQLDPFFAWVGAPWWLHGVLVSGMYRTFAWVVSVMLPPMAIFFPLFTFMEDLGYLPRVAFNLDRLFKQAGTHGKQALTMSMGFGCNAAGIIACLSQLLDPVAGIMGLDGIILLAFVLGFPANEIVVPIIIMSYLSAGAMLELGSLDSLRALLVDYGWTWLTALSVMLFSLLHYPCGTTLWTIQAETKQWKWVLFIIALTTGVACVTCTLVYQVLKAAVG